MKIIVTGSLGNIGRPLTEDLTAKGHTVTVISSQEDKRQAITSLGATAAIGTLDDSSFLTATFTGADAVFAMIPPNFRELDQIAYYSRQAHQYAAAIRQSGVKRLVHLSSIGAHLDKGTGFILGSHHAEKIIDELKGVSITHLRPAYFYTNLYNFIDMIRGAGFIGANYGGTDRIVMVHPKDIAAAAAEELTTKSAGTHVRYVSSDERTGSEAAQILGHAIGKPDLAWNVLTNEQMQEGAEKNGMPTALAVKFVEMGAALHSGVLREDYDRHAPGTTGGLRLEDFAREFAAAYQKK